MFHTLLGPPYQTGDRVDDGDDMAAPYHDRIWNWHILALGGRVRSGIKPAGVRHAEEGCAVWTTWGIFCSYNARRGIGGAQADKAPSDLPGISRAVPSNGVVRQEATVHDYGERVRPKKLTDKDLIVPPLTILGQHLPSLRQWALETLACPATSCALERVFSSTKRLVNP